MIPSPDILEKSGVLSHIEVLSKQSTTTSKNFDNSLCFDIQQPMKGWATESPCEATLNQDAYLAQNQ